jgi:hypothetical protein
MRRPVTLLRPLLCTSVLLAWAAAPAAADTLELTDGRVVEGSVSLEETPPGYRVRNRFGETVLEKAAVKTWSKGRTVDELVRERLKALPADDVENRARLAKWLVDLGRGDEGRALAEAALEIDAENATAHGVLGHERHGGRWMTPEEWANVGEAAKKSALDADTKAQHRRVAEEVNRLVRLMASPDAATRARAKKRLEDIAAETGNAGLKTLIGDVEQYIAKAEELNRAAAAGSGVDGYVVAEIRATLSKLKRPIQTFETSLASNIGGAQVKLQLPELEVINVRTMVGLPATVAK